MSDVRPQVSLSTYDSPLDYHKQKAAAFKHHAEWMAQLLHQAYHTDYRGTWRECSKDLCASTLAVAESWP